MGATLSGESSHHNLGQRALNLSITPSSQGKAPTCIYKWLCLLIFLSWQILFNMGWLTLGLVVKNKSTDFSCYGTVLYAPIEAVALRNEEIQEAIHLVLLLM